jgi:hypothetical protein
MIFKTHFSETKKLCGLVDICGKPRKRISKSSIKIKDDEFVFHKKKISISRGKINAPPRWPES